LYGQAVKRQRDFAVLHPDDEQQISGRYSAKTMIISYKKSTTQPAQEFLAAMAGMLETSWTEPASVHGPGQAVTRTVANAPAQVAGFFPRHLPEQMQLAALDAEGHWGLEAFFEIDR